MILIRKLLLAALISISILILINLEMVLYGLSQARGQLNIIWKARPIEEVLRDPDFPDSLKINLRYIDDIKQFAFDSLGINPSKNYTTVYDQQGKEIMFVVTACEPFKLMPKQWKFPILGTFSYKGFFIEHKAKKLEQKLMNEGLDTNIRTASGWSTLGWFRDPILSNMLAGSEGDFAETIIHELTHGTVFVKDSLRFNENLATFIGIKGTEGYLSNKYGPESKEATEYKNSWMTRNLLVNHILRSTLYLDSTYNAMPENLSAAVKLTVKREAIDKIIANMDTLPIPNPGRIKSHYQRLNLNNTFFMSYLRYRGDLEILEKELDSLYDGDIRKMMNDYKIKYPSL